MSHLALFFDYGESAATVSSHIEARSSVSIDARYLLNLVHPSHHCTHSVLSARAHVGHHRGQRSEARLPQDADTDGEDIEAFLPGRRTVTFDRSPKRQRVGDVPPATPPHAPRPPAVTQSPPGPPTAGGSSSDDESVPAPRRKWAPPTAGFSSSDDEEEAPARPADDDTDDGDDALALAAAQEAPAAASTAAFACASTTAAACTATDAGPNTSPAGRRPGHTPRSATRRRWRCRRSCWRLIMA